MMRINYNFSANIPLSDPEYPQKAKHLKNAGVETVWLFGYFYGQWESSVEKLYKAKKILEDDGFEVCAINIPFGHGGNALDPSNPSISLDIGIGWQNRTDANGNSLINTVCCANEQFLHDSVDVVKSLKEIGITKIFYDDDMRLGGWGTDLQGCFCEHCLERFNYKHGVNADRRQIITNPSLEEPWKAFQCASILNFVKTVSLDDITTGVMVMHNGDRQHGIDIPLIKQNIPSILFRVGEGHFDNESFAHPLAEKAIVSSIHTHMRLVENDELCYSESTVYPKKALSPENLIKKIKLEISCGLKNIYLMSGTWYLTPEYWEALANARSELLELDASVHEPKHPECNLIWHI